MKLFRKQSIFKRTLGVEAPTESMMGQSGHKSNKCTRNTLSVLKLQELSFGLEKPFWGPGGLRMNPRDSQAPLFPSPWRPLGGKRFLPWGTIPQLRNSGQG